MRERKNIVVLTGLVLAVSLAGVSITCLLLTKYYNYAHVQALGGICQKIIENQPEAELAVLRALKEYEYNPDSPPEENIILTYGYRQSAFWKSSEKYGVYFSAVGFLTAVLLFLIVIFLRHKKETARIKTLTEYLEKVNAGEGGVLSQNGEDAFSKLQDEIYKTVTELYQTRDAALRAKNNFAENLYNIAHQMKTPVTAVSLSLQMLPENPSKEQCEQIRRQLSRLTHLEESLLLLARIDTGTLPLEREEIDVFTVLMLAADNLQEMFSQAGVLADIPEAGEMAVYGDMEWTMEAIMNVMKNCIEHTPPGGAVHCAYEQNPLYIQIQIWDTGTGFAKEDIPHIFERFYRGQGTKGEGLGIGLALSKAIIERQNGTITARNLADGGACFEIRFYSH